MVLGLKIHSPAIFMAFDWLNVTGIPAKGDPAAANQDLTPMLIKGRKFVVLFRACKLLTLLKITYKLTSIYALL